MLNRDTITRITYKSKWEKLFCWPFDTKSDLVFKCNRWYWHFASDEIRFVCSGSVVNIMCIFISCWSYDVSITMRSERRCQWGNLKILLMFIMTSCSGAESWDAWDYKRQRHVTHSCIYCDSTLLTHLLFATLWILHRKEQVNFNVFSHNFEHRCNIHVISIPEN